MSGLPEETDELKIEKYGKIRRNLSVLRSKIFHDAQRTGKKIAGASHRSRLEMLLVPCIMLLVVIAIILLPGADKDPETVKTHMLRVSSPAISLAYEQDKDGKILSAWIRTPKVSRKIGQIEGLSYIADNKFYLDADGDGTKDLLWRISFNDDKGEKGVHLWVGALGRLAKIYVSSTPYVYTRWDALPTKVRTPSDCALYVSPTLPGSKARGTECYSFIYTLKLTPEGLAFIPVPSVYEQLFPLLRAVAETEEDESLHTAYVNMITEFKRLADGKIPSASTYTNLTIDKVDLLPMK